MHTKECLWLFSSVLKLRGSSVQFSSVAQSYLFLTLCNPMDCSTAGIHVHWVGDAIQPSHPLWLLLLLLSIFPGIKVFSNESDLCIKWPKYWSFSFSISPSKNIQEWFPLGLTGLISLQSKGSQEPSPASQFKSIRASALSFLYGPTLTSIHD